MDIWQKNSTFALTFDCRGTKARSWSMGCVSWPPEDAAGLHWMRNWPTDNLVEYHWNCSRQRLVNLVIGHHMRKWISVSNQITGSAPLLFAPLLQNPFNDLAMLERIEGVIWNVLEWLEGVILKQLQGFILNALPPLSSKVSTPLFLRCCSRIFSMVW